jgi:hypothetical protein
MVPHVVVTPEANTILLEETVFRVDSIWRLDKREQTMQRLVAPHYAHFPNSDWSENAALSPEGQIMAVSFDQNTAYLRYLTERAHWSGKHIAIVRVQRLGMVTFSVWRRPAHLSFCCGPPSGKNHLARFNDKGWQRYEFSDQARPTSHRATLSTPRLLL